MNGPGAGGPPEDDLVPVSVRLGTVVPPEDPEDWTRPLTWVVALGMLAGPIGAAAWFFIQAPRAATAPSLGTWLLAIAVAAGAGAAGATQIGRLRAITGTVGAGLFGALGVVLVSAVAAGGRQVGAASPSVVHGFAGAVAGVAGTVAAGAVAGVIGGRGRGERTALAAAAGAAVAAVVVPLLFGQTP